MPQLVLIAYDFKIVFELSLFAFNIRREVCGVLNYFLSFLRGYQKRKVHNMLFLMLDPKFKSFCLVFSFAGQEKNVNIVDEYDKRTLYPMFLKCYHHLHPIIESIGCVNQIGDEDSSLDIFQ